LGASRAGTKGFGEGQTDSGRLNRIRQRLAEIGHHQHAVREHIRKSGLPGEIKIDMDRIVVAGGPAIKREAMTGDWRKRLVDDAFAD